MYGLDSSEFALGNPLTPAEIASYLDLLPEDLSPERRAVITCALNSVGKIPYYYGGKPSTAGLSGNHFASVTSPDYKGRILSGLDCSGWVNWVYWTALGNRMSAASTYEIVRTGRAINSAELQPGDLLVQLGGDSHVVMFLGWNADGTILGVHETLASDTPFNKVVLMIDEAWRLDEKDFTWLMDLYNILRRYNLQLITVFFSTNELLDKKRNFKSEGLDQIVERFFSEYL